MTGLKCNVTSCASNAQYQCCRPDIQVAGLDAEDCCETCCASFENKSAAKNNAMPAVGPEPWKTGIGPRPRQ